MTEPQPLVLATRSAGKLRELRALCAAAGISCESLDEAGIAQEPDEEGIEAFATFAENAEAKARWFAARVPGRVVLAEDSGLVVEALGGRPGVHSKRWSGSQAVGAALDADNNAALLRALAGVQDRRAHYACIAIVVDGARTWRGEGHVHGQIATAARGSGGFGYDPYFLSDELGMSFGEATREAKAEVSHRGRAVRAVFVAMGAALHERVRAAS